MWSTVLLLLPLLVCALAGEALRNFIKTPASHVLGGFPSGELAPCAARRALFPEEAPPMPLPKELLARGLLLPRYGVLLLPVDATLEIYPDKYNRKSTNCERGDVIYKAPKPFNWTDPNNWEMIPRPRNFEAIPHLDRLPCQSDEVVFPEDALMIVSLPKNKQKVKTVTVNGKNLTQSRWNQLVLTGGTSTLLFQVLDPVETFDHLGVHISESGCGHLADPRDDWLCPCQPLAEDIGLLCPSGMCQNAKCANPVLPHGFCCPLCGGFVLLEILDGLSTIDAVVNLEKILMKWCLPTMAAWTVTIRQPQPPNDKRRVLLVSVVEKIDGAGKTCIEAAMSAVDGDKMRVADWWTEGLSGPLYSGGSRGIWLVCIPLILFVIGGVIWKYRKHPTLAPIIARISLTLATHTRFDGLYVRFHNLGSRMGVGVQRAEEASVLDGRRESTISYTRLSPLPTLKKRRSSRADDYNVNEASENNSSKIGEGDVRFSDISMRSQHSD